MLVIGFNCYEFMQYFKKATKTDWTVASCEL